MQDILVIRYDLSFNFYDKLSKSSHQIHSLTTAPIQIYFPNKTIRLWKNNSFVILITDVLNKQKELYTKRLL